jgi:hypothetical protein
MSALLALAGCAESPSPAPPAQSANPPAPYQCILPSEQRMLVAELFFGRDIKGRGPLSEAEWRKFAAETITPNFPEVFTAFDGDGQWQNPQTKQVGHEGTKILLVAAQRSPDLAGRLARVIDAYKTRFHQQSVGLITRDSCAAF